MKLTARFSGLMTKTIMGTGTARIDLESVAKFCKLIHNLPSNGKVQLHDDIWHVDDLKTLCCDRWLSN
jgi:hypothetical protein